MTRRLLMLLPVLWLPSLPVLATDIAETKGLTIATEAEARDSGWVDFRADLEMILRNRQGDESRRHIRLSTLEVADDGDKSLSVFDSPADVRGTAFLSHTHARRADDQWLYLPALKRVKRISSANKSGPFMGSEFAYEDLTSQELDKYTYRWLRDEPREGQQTFVIERRPTYEHSGYTRQIVWLSQQTYKPLKVEYHDRKDDLLKTLTAHDYQLYQGRYWRPGRMEMVNHQTGKSTTLLWSNYRFGNGLRDQDFEQAALKRAQ